MMIRIAIIGVGHIARHEHLPALADNAAYRLVAAVSPVAVALDVPVYETLDALIDSGTRVDAVSICTPPGCRYELACRAIASGYHVLLEKPPTLTRSQAQVLADMARERGRVVFAAWHSVYAAAVEPLRTLLRDEDPVGISVRWKENADKWHPGADWLWQPGALGVFDAGINALSILCAVGAESVLYRHADLQFFDEQQAPARAFLSLEGGRTGCPIDVELDWRHDPSHEIWTIEWTLSDGEVITLGQGGASLTRRDGDVPLGASREYAGVYRHFEQLIASGESCLDLRPLDLVTEALAFGTRARS